MLTRCKQMTDERDHADFVLVLCYFLGKVAWQMCRRTPSGAEKATFVSFLAKLYYIYYYSLFYIIDRKKVAKVVFY